MQNFRPYKLLYVFILLIICSGNAVKAQNVSSPYSEFGIGDIDTRDYNRYSAEGGTDISRRDPAAYNLSNPASLTSLPSKLMNFDVAFSGRINSFQMPGQDTSLGSSKDFTIKRIALAFKLSKSTGIAVGFKPYSTVSYLRSFTTPSPAPFNTPVYTTRDGSGGINQVYFSIGREVGGKTTPKRFSYGATLSYLFGSLIQLDDNTVPGENAGITKLDTKSYYGASLQGGIQYYTPVTSTNKWKHFIGLTATAYTSLQGQHIGNVWYDSNNVVTAVGTPTIADESFKMPYNIGLGYAATHNNFTYSADFNYYGWPSQTVAYQNSYTTPAYKISAGVEYSKKIRYFTNNAFERYFIGIGASAQNSYLFVNGNYLKEYAGSIGGGYNFSNSLSLTGAFEFGVKGDLGAQQIQETFTNIIVGLTFKNLWFGTKKFGRFQ